MLKRLFDIAASTVGLIVLSPVLIILGIAVKLGSPGPIFYRANRVGRYGENFKLLKFRSMVIDADKIGPAVTGAFDPRITRVGRLLRRRKLDELPQLINVFRGDMSVVGPRPEDPRYVDLYTSDQRRVLAMRPGITSRASLKFRSEELLLTGDNHEKIYIETIMPHKLNMDLEYLANSNFLTDLKVILDTILAVTR